MQNFEYYNPTRLIFGRGEIASLTRPCASSSPSAAAP